MLIVGLEANIETWARMISGDDIMIRGAMSGIAMRHAAKDGELVHRLGNIGKLVTDAGAGDIGRHVFEWTPYRRRGIGLHVEGIDGTQPAFEEHEDEGDIILCLLPGGGLCGEKLVEGKAEAKGAACSYSKKIAARTRVWTEAFHDGRRVND